MLYLKSKQAFIILLISLFYFYGICLNQGKAENITIVYDSQQIPTDAENTIKSHVETESISPRESLQILEEKEASSTVKEKNACSFPFSRLLFTTILIDEQSHSQEKGTQTITPDERVYQSILKKLDTTIAAVAEGNDIKKEPSSSPDLYSVATEEEISSNIDTEDKIFQTTSAHGYSDTSTAEIQSSPLEEQGTQTPVIKEDLSLEIASKYISSTDDTTDSKNSQNNISCNEDVLKIEEKNEISSIISATEPSSTGEGISMIEKEKGTQTDAIVDKQQEIISDEENTSSSEEKLLNELISSTPSESSTVIVTEKEPPDVEDEGTPTLAVENKPHMATDENESPFTPLEESSHAATEGSSDVLNKEIRESQKGISSPETPEETAKEAVDSKPAWDIWHTNPTLSIIIAVAITLIAAKIGGWLASMVMLPEVVGNLIVGIILGNFFFLTGSEFFDFLRTMPFLKMISYFGTLLLLLTAGLHTDLRALLRVGASSFLVSLGGIVAPAGLGLIVSYFLLSDTAFSAKLLLAIIICNTSTGLLFAILSELKVINTLEGRIITGATILTEIIVILTFGIASGIATKGEVSVLNVLVTSGIAFSFLAAVLIVVLKYGERFGNFLTSRVAEGLKISIVIILSLLFAFVSGSIGLHGVIGAFAAGLLLRNVKFKDSDDKEYSNVERVIRPYYMILVPILFVRVGAQVDLSSILNMEAVLLGLAITGAAIFGKLFCSVCPIEKGINRIVIGIGMAMKLEGTLILSGIGRDMGILDDVVFSSIIMVIVFTSITCPSLLKASLVRQKRRLSKNFRVSVDEKTKEIFIRFKNEVRG